MNYYETYEYRGYTIKIAYDDVPAINPLKDYDHLATMSCYHRRYDLSTPDNPYEDDQEGLHMHLKTGKCLFLPVYGYEHSGMTISTGKGYPFNDPWDSGQLGYVWVDKEKVRKEWNVKRISPALKKRVLDNMRAMVSDVDSWLTGQVYGYILEDENGEEMGSCWGFIGDPDESGVKSEPQALVDHRLKQIGVQTELFK